MKVRSIKSNYMLNIIRLTSSLLIALFTMPYINRVLGPEYLGKIEYIISIVNYFILFSGLGIPLYGVKQISKVRDNREELSKVICELLFLLLATTLTAYTVLFSFLFLTSGLNDYKLLIIIMSSMILLTNIGLEWLYQGLEDQLYITVRTLIIRVISLILIFLFVKSVDDYLLYGGIVVFSMVGGNVFNIFRARRYIYLHHLKVSNLNVTRHVKPAFAMFIASISVSIYVQIDTFLLGYISGDLYVGYYSVANKLNRFAIIFVTTLGIVMLPRLSNLWINNRPEYYRLLNYSFIALMLFSVTTSVYILVFSESIINIIGGLKFNESILTMRILAPISFLVAIAYYSAFLVLYVRNKEIAYSVIVTLTAILSVILNIILIPKYNHNGAAISQLISEIFGCMLLVFTLKKYKMLKNSFNNVFSINFLKIILVNVVISVLFYFILKVDVSFNELVKFTLYSLLYMILYISILLSIKEKYTSQILMKYIK